MNRPAPNRAVAPVDGDEAPASSFRGILYKSALLNAVIVLTSLPVLVVTGGPRAVAPSLAIMAGITVVIWTATFTLCSCVSIGRLLFAVFTSRSRRKPPAAARRVGLADQWLDGPG